MSLPTLLVPGSLKCAGQVISGKPIDYICEWVGSKLPDRGNVSYGNENRILIIHASTGSGKSTVIPVALVRMLRGVDTVSEYEGPGIICTQPRVLTAISLAMDVSVQNSPWNVDIVLGTTVGYSTGPRSVGVKSKLIYATIGILIVQFKRYTDEEIINKYKVIIVDEAHERSTDLDLLLLMLKNFYARNKRNPNTPILLFTSATIEAELFRSYFDLPPENLLEVEGRAYPIREHWPEVIENNYIEWAAKIVADILERDPVPSEMRTPKNDILIFVPGAQECKMLYELLNTFLDKNPHHGILLLTLNSDVVNQQLHDFKLVFTDLYALQPVRGHKLRRRVIVSTIVAETGLTINTLKHVIDCGWTRSKETYYPWGLTGLITRPSPQSRIKQRKGRVGRLFAGEYYPMYSRETYDQLLESQYPEIIINGMSSIFISTVAYQQDQQLFDDKDNDYVIAEYSISESGLITPPNANIFINTQIMALSCGFISPRAELPSNRSQTTEDTYYLGYGLTKLGRIAAKLDRIPIDIVRVLLAGYQYNVAMSDLLFIAALSYGTKEDLLLKRGRMKKSETYEITPRQHSVLHAAPKWLLKKFEDLDRAGQITEISKLLADEFIEDLFICEAFVNVATDLDKLTEYCEAGKIHFDNIMEVIRLRDEIADNMIGACLNPLSNNNRRLSVLQGEDFLNTLQLIKQCIGEGFRMNLLTRVAEDKPIYSSVWGVEIDAGKNDLIKMKNPKYFISDKIILNSAEQIKGVTPLLYVPDISRVSIIDGFYIPDINILEAKNAFKA